MFHPLYRSYRDMINPYRIQLFDSSRVYSVDKSNSSIIMFLSKKNILLYCFMEFKAPNRELVFIEIEWISWELSLKYPYKKFYPTIIECIIYHMMPQYLLLWYNVNIYHLWSRRIFIQLLYQFNPTLCTYRISKKESKINANTCDYKQLLTLGVGLERYICNSVSISEEQYQKTLSSSPM